MVRLAPSVLSADFARLGDAVELINRSEADWIHCDVMDGRFVPNISFGLPVVQAIRRLATKPLDVHLMIAEPERYLQAFAQAGADILTVHAEACPHLHRVLQEIRSLGLQCGVAINPHTPVSVLSEVIADVDLVCLMSVNPGFGGQTLIPHTYAKLAALRELIASSKSAALIEVDGGVDLNHAGRLAAAGADVLVAGNSVFATENPAESIRQIKQRANTISV